MQSGCAAVDDPEFQRAILERDGDATWRVRNAGEQGSGTLSYPGRADALIVLPHERGPVDFDGRAEVVPVAAFL